MALSAFKINAVMLSCPDIRRLCYFFPSSHLLLPCMQVTTVKSILNDAGQKFGMNMKPRKPIISGTITQFLEASKAGQDPFAALGLETQQEAPNASDMRKVQGRVIVVGAGPAGLAAALHLKVSWCGGSRVVQGESGLLGPAMQPCLCTSLVTVLYLDASWFGGGTGSSGGVQGLMSTPDRCAQGAGGDNAGARAAPGGEVIWQQAGLS